MSDDRDYVERFTDDELAFLRHVRFGELPSRIAWEDLVAVTETDLAHEEPQQPAVRREWG